MWEPGSHPNLSSLVEGCPRWPWWGRHWFTSGLPLHGHTSFINWRPGKSGVEVMEGFLEEVAIKV